MLGEKAFSSSYFKFMVMNMNTVCKEAYACSIHMYMAYI